MHDLDRTLRELESGMDGFEMGMDALEMGMDALESTDGEFEAGYDREWDGEYDPEFEGEYDQEWDGELDPEAVFDEIEEMELAAHLMEIADEQEFEQFLGQLVRRAGQRVAQRVGSAIRRSPLMAVHRVLRDTGRAALPGLQDAARQALPVLGGGVGDLLVPGGRGRAGGQQIGGGVGTLLGLEVEGLSPQDQEFEVSRRFVRLAGDAVRGAARAGNSAPALAAARRAVLAAARQHAPGLVRLFARGGSGGAGGGDRSVAGEMGGPLRPRRPGGDPSFGHSGRWIRRGRSIVLLGI